MVGPCGVDRSPAGALVNEVDAAAPRRIINVGWQQGAGMSTYCAQDGTTMGASAPGVDAAGPGAGAEGGRAPSAGDAGVGSVLKTGTSSERGSTEGVAVGEGVEGHEDCCSLRHCQNCAREKICVQLKSRQCATQVPRVGSLPRSSTWKGTQHLATAHWRRTVARTLPLGSLRCRHTAPMR